MQTSLWKTFTFQKCLLQVILFRANVTDCWHIIVTSGTGCAINRVLPFPYKINTWKQRIETAESL